MAYEQCLVTFVLLDQCFYAWQICYDWKRGKYAYLQRLSASQKIMKVDVKGNTYKLLFNSLTVTFDIALFTLIKQLTVSIVLVF
ncbi:hypothetical protein PTD2_17325 [Pseudoalteromonas tunicata D2]|uniref:Uncharacterized protein n=1 Tax=Pseudoalteromonas tunicata D2 TaxID=87626 RepID=A4CB68_9GAMM|nr:hypothetical protein PTD2_17325 [Pseudoalteromonas tunicata D2]